MSPFSSKALAIVLIPGFLLSCSKQQQNANTPAEAIDRIVQPYIATGADVGIIVGTVQNGSVTIYSYGQKELGSTEKIAGESVLEIASLTKVYTGLALAVMHWNGEVNIDDPIENYLPASYHVPAYNGHKITLRHLANHTAGFPRYPDNIDGHAYNMYAGYTEEDLIVFLDGFELTREPGSQTEYSNVGYGLLGHILSLVHGSDYETMLAETVLQQLGMQHTTVSFTPDQLAHLVHGHNGCQQVESWSQYLQNIFQGSGSLISSMNDQLLFLRANMGLLSSPLDPAIAFSHHPVSGPADAIPFGWSITDLGDLHVLSKNGGNGGYGSFMGFDKTRQIGVVVLCNSSLNPELFPTDIGFDVLEALREFE